MTNPGETFKAFTVSFSVLEPKMLQLALSLQNVSRGGLDRIHIGKGRLVGLAFVVGRGDRFSAFFDFDLSGRSETPATRNRG